MTVMVDKYGHYWVFDQLRKQGYICSKCLVTTDDSYDYECPGTCAVEAASPKCRRLFFLEWYDDEGNQI